MKIAPDLEYEEIVFMANNMADHEIDGIIATNTTLKRDGLEAYEESKESGGLSGYPLQDLSTYVLRELKEVIGDRMPIIGVGGVMDGAWAKEKFEAGASLIQIYSGFIYRGPNLLKEIADVI